MVCPRNPGRYRLPYFKDDTPIILDLSDIAKPLARKMDYLAIVRDGSTGESSLGKAKARRDNRLGAAAEPN
jgi:hypothetical protein